MNVEPLQWFVDLLQKGLFIVLEPTPAISNFSFSAIPVLPPPTQST